MGNKNYFLLIAYLCLINKLLAAPVSGPQVDAEFCTGDDLLKYENGKEYAYDYSTKTALWINDVSEESKSTVELKAKVFVRSVTPCLYLLRLEESSVTGESINKNSLSDVLQSLNDNPVQFRLNSRGELDSNVDFTEGDKPWSRNIKRGILSALQLKSTNNLRNLDNSLENTGDAKSAVVYETDVLGRCRTTYIVKDSSKSSEVKLNKKKSLQRCTLNGNSKTSAIRYVPYKNIPEFYQGRLFVETHECETTVKNGIIDEVECDERSTYKLGSRGSKGAQAVVEQKLKYLRTLPGYDRRAVGPFETQTITFEFTDKSVDDLEYRDLNIDSYLNDLCSRVKDKNGLNNDHSNNFRSLVNKLEEMSKDDLYKLYTNSKAKCNLAGSTVSHALIFTNTENSFETVLKLLDENAFIDQVYITEYPLLTFLARHQEPGLNFLKKLDSYIESKNKDFVYTKKMYLVYSALVKKYCLNNACDESLLNDLSSVFAKNIGSNCADSSNKELVTSSLKAIGNIGYLKNVKSLANCASKKDNSLEVRISAIQAFRRFECSTIENTKELFDLLKNTDEDTEVRINVFQILVKCTETEKFQQLARDYLPSFFEKETDSQLLTYVIDYGKEHDLTVLVNPILSNPKLKEKFTVNFKELSWNNFRYRYSVLRDGAIELDTSVIYNSQKTFIPRSVRFNATLHLFGMSVNVADVTVRLEGLEDILKGIVIDKLTSEKLLKKLLEKPENLIDILQIIADKLKYTSDKPFISLTGRVYGSDVFYSELDDIQKLKKLSEFLKNPRDNLLYAQAEKIRNLFLVDSRVRQPLLNGFEFNTFFDIGLSLLTNKQGTKAESAEKRVFNIDNLWSSSIAINRRFEVQLNKNNKIALKKKAFVNTKLRMNINGEKTNGTAVYNLNLTPSKEVPLFVFDGKFYKLGSNSQYIEVTKFSVERHRYQNCTSQNFHNQIGVDLCISIDRPKLGSLLESLRPVDLDRTLNDALSDDDDDDDDDNDDDDDEDQSIYGSVKRPKLVLSGPYHYEITLKNPDLVKTLVLNAAHSQNENSRNLNAVLKTVSASNDVKDRLQLTYSRSRNNTNRALERSVNLELKVPSTQEIRFRLAGIVSYRKQEILNVQLHLNNKVLRELNFDFEFLRDKKDHVVPTYKLEALLDSKVREHRQRRFILNVIPNGKDIKSDLIVEKSDSSTDYKLVRLVDAILTLSANEQQKSSSGIDYNVDLQVETKRPSKTHLYGHLAASQLQSNIDLSLEYSGPMLKLSEPVSIRFGHALDVSAPGAKSYIEFGAKLPSDLAKVNHNVKLIFEANAATFKVNYAEVQVKTPKTEAENNGAPYIVYIGKHETENDQTNNVEFTAGVNNFRIDLSNAQTSIGKALVKLDDNSILKSLSIEYTRIKDQSKNSRDVVIKAKKNDVVFVHFHSNLYGSTKDIRNSPNEIPKQSLGAQLHVKVLDYSGGVEAKLGLENSVKNKQHAYSFEFQTENLFKILLKVASINSKLTVNGNKINAEYEMTKLGEVKSFKFASKSDLRTSGDSKEFDVDYVKTLASGDQLKASGTVKYKWNDLKNFDASLDLANNFNFKIAVKNQRSGDEMFGYHDLYMKYAHLDIQQAERELKLLINNKTEQRLRSFTFNFMAKKGKPNTLGNIDELDYIFDANTLNVFSLDIIDPKTSKPERVSGANNLLIKSKQTNINLDIKSNSKLDTKTKDFTANIDAMLKFPAITSDPGKLNVIKEKLTYTKNLANQKRAFKFSSETDNKIIGRLFKSINVDYTRQPVDKNVTSVDLAVTFVNPADETKNINVKLERTNCKHLNDDNDDDNEIKQYLKFCSGTKLNIKQNIVAERKSSIAEGKTFDISECNIETKLIRKKQDKPSYDYLLDVLTAVKCKDKTLINNGLYVHRYAPSSDDLKTTEARLVAQSDLYYEKRSYELRHEKFSAQKGSSEINIQRGSSFSFSNKFSYTRELNEKTRKLSKGNYKLVTSFGSSTTKSCEMNIDSKQNYYNKLSCKIKSPKLPVELSYGYSLKVNNQKDLEYGKRSIELDINLPTGRQLRAENNAQRALSASSDQFDDDDDINNERELISNTKLFWDYSKDTNKFLTVNIKRDNYGKTNTKLLVEVSSPTVKSLKLIIDRKRLFNETDLSASVSYELANNNAKNQLDVKAKLNSDLDSNHISVETSLQKPSLNILYENKFNKLNGRLQYLGVRVGKLLRFSVDKEFDPDNRLIRLELANPDESKYSVESSSENKNSVYVVQSKLKKNNDVLTILESKFDSNNNQFDVNVNAVKANQQYKLNVGLYNESVANAVIKHVSNNNLILGIGSIRIVDKDCHNDIELSLKWNRLWNKIQKDILNNQEQENKAVENSKYNSYLGDVYGSLVNDLKPSVEIIRKERLAVKNDVTQALLLIGEFYTNFLPSEVRARLAARVEERLKNSQSEQAEAETQPLAKRIFTRYNNLARNLNSIHLSVRKVSKTLAKYVPRLTVVTYNENQEPSNKMASQFDNNIVASRPTYHAYNLYQFNAEYRDYMRRLANRYLSIKSGLLRNLGGVSLRALINKYKYRSLRDYTMVAHVFNRRNVLAFNGESRILKSKCKYLLAHELSKNQFTVVLNNNNDNGVISVSAYGQPAIDINGEKATIGNKQIALPYIIELPEKSARIVVKKNHNSVSVQVNNDLLVNCYDNSKSCSIALTRWYTGKVNGLLGRSNHDLDNVEEDNWYLDKSCKLPNLQLKKANEESVKACYSIFGRHRRSVFRNAIQAINPVGWQRICEAVLTADVNNRCPVMRAFVYHAKLKAIDVDEPNECYECQAGSKSFPVGQSFRGSSDDLFESGSDYVFVFFPCDKNKHSLDLSSSAKKLLKQNPGNRYHFVKIHENNGASIYQSEQSETYNFDFKKAYQTIAEDKTSYNIRKEDLYNALFLAGSLFTNRLAQNRHLILVSCGNCIPYSSIAALRLDKLFDKRNIIVSAWDEYEMVDNDNNSADEIAFGYGQDHAFLTKKGTNDVEADALDGYKLEHSGDLCHRLAVKTDGNVFNLSYMKKPQIFEKVAKKLEEIKPKYKNELKKCERVDTPFGDVDDFSYKRIEIE